MVSVVSLLLRNCTAGYAFPAAGSSTPARISGVRSDLRRTASFDSFQQVSSLTGFPARHVMPSVRSDVLLPYRSASFRRRTMVMFRHPRHHPTESCVGAPFPALASRGTRQPGVFFSGHRAPRSATLVAEQIGAVHLAEGSTPRSGIYCPHPHRFTFRNGADSIVSAPSRLSLLPAP